MSVFIVTLRRPEKNDARRDPFWEVGSFGCTGCHKTNLLHPARCRIMDGDRLAFVQGGQHGARLLLVTPAVTRVNHGSKLVELQWDASHQPFRYSETAPRLLGSSHPGYTSLFPKFEAALADTRRSTIDAKFASRFRARASALEKDLADEVVAGFERAASEASPAMFISTYTDALPWFEATNRTVEDRRQEYRALIREIGRVARGASQAGRTCR